ncbi:conserved hypothetical protein [Candidatus Nitrotoga sp. BS]|uniref:hypothetical protein n=1 Tax=Candidatus Nitrotoga sp. BS TaxID=2890408 RepID=UPI001EF28DAD|nr:hypothetical protein [Candidatus Nitrotoga sp. BS]CAH1203104.1 conserved hypothetical protein [Candidatus Nitrotoga sp. BS]
MNDDKRLERLYDYTKWHIGIYLSVAGALTAAVGYLAEENKTRNLAPYVGSPKLLLAAVIFMFLAGVCGAVIASSSTECKTYDELWLCKQGPYGLRLMPGRVWAMFEHSFFWLSSACIALSVLTAEPVLKWLAK